MNYAEMCFKGLSLSVSRWHFQIHLLHNSTVHGFNFCIQIISRLTCMQEGAGVSINH